MSKVPFKKNRSNILVSGMKRFAPARKVLTVFLFLLLLVLSLILRISLYHVETSDYTVFLSQWYTFIQTRGGFAALKYTFSNYNMPYLYLLTLATYLPVPELVAIKTISVLFDVVLASFTYLILRLKYKRSLAAPLGVLVILLAPTIFINSAAWGQADATYTAFCLASLYFLLKDRPGWACVCFGLAISFKLQAVFFAPVLLMLLMRRKLSWKYLVFIPTVFLLLLLPAFIAGRDALSLLTIYEGQISTGGVGGGAGLTGGPQTNPNNGQFNNSGNGQINNQGERQFNNPPAHSEQQNRNGGRSFNGGGRIPNGGRDFTSSTLTLNAPSFYQWLPSATPDGWKWLGIALAGLFVIGLGLLLLRSREALTPAILLKVALVFALAIPFLLPKMHERYFFLADVLSLVYVFYFPRLFFVAILMQVCSLLSYAPYFLNTQIVSLSYVAGLVLLLLMITLIDLLFALYPAMRKALMEPPHTTEKQSSTRPALATPVDEDSSVYH